MERRPRLIALLAGVLAATGFAPLDAWPLTILGLAILTRLAMRAPTIGHAALIGYAFGIGHFTLGNNWIAGAFRFQDAMPQWLGYFAVLALALYLAVYPALAAGLARLTAPRGGFPFALVFAATWIISEICRATFFTGFAWDPIGAALLPTWVVGWSRLIGTYGLSGLAVLGAALATVAWPRRSAVLALTSGTLAIAVAGWVLLLPDPGLTDKTVRIVQPNINLVEIRDPFAARAVVDRLATLSGAPGKSPRLIFWSEGALPDVYEVYYDASVRAGLAEILGPKDALLAGATRIEYKRKPARRGVGIEEHAIGAQNSLFMLDAAGRITGRYDKAHLVPYGEYLPMRTLLTPLGLARLVPGDLDFWPGPGPRSLAIPGFGKVGLQICYEIIFSGQVVDRADRPDFLYNASIDAWFGKWGPPQHLAQAQLRAIEEGLPIVRATPTGISAVIDVRGTLIKTIPLGTAGYIETRLPGALTPTPFARFGNWLPFGFALLIGAGGVALGRRRR